LTTSRRDIAILPGAIVPFEQRELNASPVSTNPP